jgi:Ion channel
VLHNSVAVYLGTLIFLFVTAPFVRELTDGRAIEGVVITVVLVMAVLAVGGRRRTFALAIALVMPALAAKWAHHFHPVKLTDVLSVASFLAFVGFVVVQFLWFILRSPRVNSEVLCAAVATYLMLALLWGTAYALLGRASPGAFNGLPAGQTLDGYDALYFSIITLTTIGYGDITPASGPARMLATTEAITGTMYMAMLVARLVSLYSSANASSGRDDATRT